MIFIPRISNRLRQWQRQQPEGPWRLLALPTYRCNVDCGICIRNWSPMPKFLFDELPDDRWLRLVDEAWDLGVHTLVIGGGGEPMLRDKLVTEMCVKAKQRGMEGRLQTNGTRLSEESIEALVRAGWDCVSISLDGPDEAVNDVVRFKGAFARIVKALHTLREIKAAHRSTLPTVSVHLTITAQNHDRLEDMVTFCRENGVEMLVASPLIERGMEGTNFLLNAKQRAALPEYVRKAAGKADAERLPHIRRNLLMLLETLTDGTSGGRPLRLGASDQIVSAHCLEPWTGLSIVSSGHVSPCCFFWDEQADSIRDKGLREVWLGPYLTEFRKRMLDGRVREECVHCPFPHTAEHVALKEFLQAMENAPTSIGLLGKVVGSLRNHGMCGSYRRFREWRAIRRALREERKSRR